MSTPISFVQAPFLVGQKGAEVQNLQNVLLQFAAQGLITASTTLTGQVNTEMTNAELGSATAQLVKIFIAQNRVVPSSDLLVDDVVAGAINLLINKTSLLSLKNTASGYVVLSNVTYLPTVTLYQAFLRNKVAIATAPIDENGFYFISYDASLLDTSGSPNIALQIAVHSGDQPSKEFPSDILYGATGNDQINLGDVVSNTAYIEYIELSDAISDVTGDIQFTDIILTDASEVTHLAQQTGESEDRIAQFIAAQKIAHQLNNAVNADIIYGLIRQNISVAFQSLIGQPDETLKQNLVIAIVNNIISGYTEAQIPAIVTTLKNALLHFLISDSTGDAASSTTHEVIKHVFYGNDDATQSFLNAYYSYKENSEQTFWEYIATFPSFSGQVAQLKDAINLITLAGNNPALIISLYDKMQPPPMRSMVAGITTQLTMPSFASFSKTDWVNTITAAQQDNSSLFAIPASIPGSTPTERISNYADVLQGNFGSTFPTQSVNTQIIADNNTPFQNLQGGLSTFINQNSNFDIRTASILDLSDTSNTNFNFSGISDRPAFVEEVGIVQRLMNVTPDNNVIAAMALNGLHSSVQIAQTSRETFVSQYSTVAQSAANANAIYTKAQSVATYNMAAAIDKYFQLNGKNFYALGDLSTAPSGAYAEWRTLFGPLDSCNCSQCTSVYSPSAYMTDMLRFIRNNVSGNIHDALINVRRPDIKDIELSCKNTNTSVPQIDMVNEMLEDLVSTGQYKMYARQTVADANYQRAIPEYINTSGMDFGAAHVDSPYPKLKGAKYPQTLPYNFYKRQIDTHLGIAGIKGHELIQRFGAFNKPDAFSNPAYCFAYLGLSNEEIGIITTAPATTGNLLDLMEAYGFKALNGTGPRLIPDPAARGSYINYAGTTWQNVLAGRVDVFLQQTQLQYTDLLQLLDCYTLNPATYSGSTVTRKMEIAINSRAKSADTCDLDKLQITGVDNKVLAILHRFVRTAKALNWTFYELDKAMRIFAPENTSTSAYINNSILTTLVQVKRVTELLKCTVEEACTLWTADLDTLPYRDYTKSEPADIPNQYQRVFCNPLVASLKTPDYPFKEDGTLVSVTPETLRKYLSGALNMAPAEVDLLASSSFTPSHPLEGMDGISDFYKYALMVKKLKIPVKDWLSYNQWISNTAFFGNPVPNDPSTYIAANPFESPLKAIQFIGFARLLKEGNFTLKDVEYLLRDNIADTIADSNQTASFIKTLTNFRSELAKKMYPDYDATQDTGSQKLQEAILPVMDAEKATRLIAILENVTAPYSDDDVILVDETLRFLIPEGGASILTDPTSTAPNAYIADVIGRRNYVYNCLKSYTEVSILKPAAINFFAKEFKVDQDVTQLLLESCISVSTTIGGITTRTTGYNTLLRPGFLSGTDVITRWDENGNAFTFDDQFKVILQFHKASLLITKFGLGLNDVQHLWVNNTFPAIPMLAELPVRSNISTLPNPTTGTYRTIINLLGWMQVRAFVGTDTSVLFDGLDQLSPNKKQDALNTISTAFKMSVDDLSVLLGSAQISGGTYADNGCLNVTYPLQFKSPVTYQRIIDTLEMQHLLPASMQTLSQAAQAVIAADTQDTASKIIQIVKAQYDDKQWMDIVKPVNDVLRVERRDAMIAYLLAYPVAGYEYKWLTDNDIYETMMVDVEMMPCMPTTRVLLAINTIQLWIERILLGLETFFALSKDMARQWNTWRKLYRVWEANRKIFLYPENWIEPELRDGKSSFFLELEKYLKQNEVTKENVEDAYATYLERLDEVAHLDIVGVYRDTTQSINTFTEPNADILHVFGRTKAAPHIYYYRKYAANEWTPWEKMNVKIDSDHVIPVIWRGRLRFYWLNFTKDVIQQTATNMRSQEKFTAPDPVRWKIDLAWTEYKNGNWTAQQIGDQSWYSFAITEEDPISRAHLDYYASAYGTYPRDWYLAGALDRVKKDRLNFFCSIDDDDQLKFNVVENVFRMSYASAISYFGKLTTSYKDANSSPKNLGLVDDVNLRRAIADLKNMSDLDIIAKQYSDHFGNNGSFTVKFNGVIASQKNDPPKNLYHDFVDSASLLQHGYVLDGTSYNYTKTGTLGYTHFPDANIRLLNNVPTWDKPEAGNHLIFPRYVKKGYTQGTNIQIPYFFYKDYKNTFFVEKFHLPFATVNINPNVNLGEQPLPTRPNLPASGKGNSGYQPGFPGSAWLPPGTDLPIDASFVVSSYQYRFHNFHHDNVDDFMDRFSSQGLDGLLDRSYLDSLQDTIGFVSNYSPVSGNVDMINIPNNKVDFSSTGAYSSYNWELFYHIPMLIANKLSQNQQFEDARNWYQYIFDPTVMSPNNVSDFWNFKPFNDIGKNVPSINDVMQDTGLQTAVNNWANDPFKPHLVARTRPSAYMKNTVMKYLDNLIGWGDNLFSTDTRENINEATLVYVLAAQILGRRPAKVPARAKSKVYTYATLSTDGVFNAFANASVKIESLLLASGATGISTTTNNGSQMVSDSMYYFCLPSNDQMDQYWDIIADRLFKIRHCQNINGIERELALFDPPIDPALLVRAAAAGLSLSEALSGINAPLPNYRFNVLSQKATELAQEVKSLGGQLLSALEKKDAESLALLRSSQEIAVLDAVTELKEKQIEESTDQVDALNIQLQSTTQRRDYYSQLVNGGLIGQEQLQLASTALGLTLTASRAAVTALASTSHLIPNVMIGAFSAGAQFGGSNYGKSIGTFADTFGIATGLNNAIGAMSGINAGFQRRSADWGLQLKLAETELTQIQKQIAGAEIRKAMAEVELQNHKLQMRNAQDMDTAMRDKYTNEDLYDWMIGQISFSYFQAYKLASDIAKRAERCYQYELGIETSNFIQSGYWDNLKKGLLAGEQLMFDIKRMETSYLEQNKRQLELTKHISLALFDAEQLISLRKNKKCTIDLPEWLFDMDYPGQHMRRIKSVSISIPCVSGPYTTISCKLSLVKSKYRKNGFLLNGEYVEVGDDSRFVNQYGNIQSIATSHAQNDAGMFEFNFRDERYLPFEGTGAISTWALELPAVYAQFDYNSIADVILHVKYTALDGGAMTQKAKETIQARFEDGGYMPRYYSLKHEFANEWNQYSQAFTADSSTMLSLTLSEDQFPYFCKGKEVSTLDCTLFMRADTPVTVPMQIEMIYGNGISVTTDIDMPNLASQIMELSIPVNGSEIGFRLKKKSDGSYLNLGNTFNDVYMVINYFFGDATNGGGPVTRPQGIGYWKIATDFIVQ